MKTPVVLIMSVLCLGPVVSNADDAPPTSLSLSYHDVAIEDIPHVSNETTPLLAALDDEGPGESVDVSGGGGSDVGDLAKKTQNPVSDLISLPFQNNTSFNVGPKNRVQNVLNIQPVIPFTFDNFNLITRTILPVIYQPSVSPGTDDEFGLGNLQFTAFISPKNEEGLIFGVGPVLQFPTNTDDALGLDKWSAGPSIVGLMIEGPWVVGGLAQQVWSYCGEGDDPYVSEFLLQPFVNYNLDDGWYLVTAPIITANWNAKASDVWTIPLGGGFGRVVKLGNLPINFQVQSFYNVATPANGGEWSIRFQMQFLFPKG
jgi:hypothetical protein